MTLSKTIIILCALFCAVSQAFGQTICFQRNGAIWLADANGSNQRLLITSNKVKEMHAYDFRISPDGQTLSCIISIKINGDPLNFNRGILLFDIKTQQSKLLDAVPELNNYDATWSPDGSKLIFKYPYKNPINGITSSVAMIDKTNNNFKIITDCLGPKDYFAYNFCWFANSKSILVESGGLFYSIDEQGTSYHVESFKVLEQVNPEYICSSATQFRLSKDSILLAFDPEVHDDGSKNFQSYGESIYNVICIYDRKNGQTLRLTSKNISARLPEWVANGEAIIFEGLKGIISKKMKKIATDIYKINVKTGKYYVIIKNASYPSISSY